MMEFDMIVILPMRIECLSASAEWTFLTNSVLIDGIMRRRNRGKRLV